MLRHASRRLAALCVGLLTLAACSDEARNPEAVISGPAEGRLGGVVQVDGSRSHDPEGGRVSFQWRLARLPASSAAAFNDTTIANPSFLVDVPGEYVVELIVSSGSRLSAPISHVISVAACGARAPAVTAIHADPATPSVGEPIRLSAAVADEDNGPGCDLGQTLSYAWQLRDLPTQSRAILNDPALASPVFAADRSGTYTVVLTLTDSAGLSSAAFSAAIEVSACGEARPEITGAGATPTDPAVGQTVQLTAAASDADNGEGCGAAQPLSFEWTLLSAPPASRARIERAARAEAWIEPDVGGTYALAVIARDSTGRASDAAELTIAAGDADVAVTAGATPPAGLAPLTVDFTCTATGDAPIQYGWAFGDGAVSSLQNPVYTYARAGSFTATCLAVDVDGDSATASVAIAVAADTAPTVEATADPRAGVAPLEVSFSGLVRGGEGEVSTSWQFGDGKTSTDAAPVNTFVNPGLYAVTVTVTDDDGDSGSDLIEIAVGSDAVPAAAIGATPVRAIAPVDVQLEAFTAGGNGPLTYRWDFDDGETSPLQNPRHRYDPDNDETFTVELTVRDVDGDEATAELDVFVEADESVSAVTAEVTPAAGRVPLLVGLSCGATGGNAPVEYTWTFGDGGTSDQQNPTHIYLDSNEYTATCTATDADGDVRSDSVQVSASLDRTPTASLSADRTRGVAPLTVDFRATGTGGDGTLVYRWDFGNGEALPSGAAVQTRSYGAGTYQVGVTVEDQDGDTDRATLLIEVDPDGPPLAVAVHASPAQGIAPLEVRYSANVAGGNPPYRFAWDFGAQGTSTLANPSLVLPAGTHDGSLIVTDADGDESDAEVVRVVVAADLVPVIGTLAADADDLGLAPLLVDFACPVTGGNPPLAFEWSFGDGQGSRLQNPSHTYATPGAYVATCRVADADGDTPSANIDQTASLDTAPIPAILGGPRAGLAPLDIDFASSVVGGNGAITRAWDFGDPAIAEQGSADPDEVTFGTPGSFTVVLRATDEDGDAGAATATVLVGTDEEPVVAIEADRTTGVAPLTVRFSATVAGGNGASTLAWDLDGDGAFDDGMAAGVTWTYTTGPVTVRVRATDEDGSDAENTLVITPMADVLISGVTALSVVTGENTLGLAPLTAEHDCNATGGNPPITYHWSFGDGATSTLQRPGHTYAAPGTYTGVCTATDADGDQDSATTIVVVNPDTTPAATITATPVNGTLGPDGQLAVHFDSVVTGGNGALAYAWDVDGEPGPDSTLPTFTHLYEDEATYPVRLVVTDEDDDPHTATLDVVVREYTAPTVVASAVPSSGISPASVRLFANTAGGDGALAFAWDFGEDDSDDIDSSERNPTFVYTTGVDATFTATVFVTDAAGEEASDSVDVFVARDAVPAVDDFPAPAVDRTRAPVTASFTCDFTSPNGPNRLQWVFGDGQTVTVNNATPPQATVHTYGVAGSYAAQCIVSDGDDDTHSLGQTVVVAGNSTPIVTLATGATTGIAPLTVDFRASALGGDGPITWTWHFGGGSALGAANTANESASFGAGTFIASVTGCDENGDCDSRSATIAVAGDLHPSVAASGAPRTGESPLTVQLSAGATGGNPPLSVLWTFSDGTSAAGHNVSHTFIAPAGGDFTAVATVRDADGDAPPAGIDSVDIHVAAPNRRPVAAISSSCSASWSTPLGSSSSDPDGDPLTYAWSLLALEPGSQAQILHPALANAVLSVDRDGFYEVLLEVSDGRLSARASALIEVDTVPIVTAATPSLTGRVGDELALSARVENGCGAPFVGVCFLWLETPEGTSLHRATLDDPTTATDVDGVVGATGVFGPDPGSGGIDVCVPASCGGVLVDGHASATAALVAPMCWPLFEVTALCNATADCTNVGGGLCEATGGLCQAPTCTDDLQNQGEAEIDCGGPACLPCGLMGADCDSAEDCVGGFCDLDAGACVGPWFVDAAAPGPGDGTSWDSPFDTLQAALAAADDGQQIWMAAGRYTPPGVSSPWMLGEGVAIYGGFAGEYDIGDRDWEDNATVLDGDLAGDDVGFANRGDNARRFIRAANRASLNGVTIRGGHASGPSFPEHDGGAILMNFLDESFTIQNALITQNWADQGGGAMYGGASPLTLRNVRLVDNRAAGQSGAIMAIAGYVDFEDVAFERNVDSNSVGAMTLHSAPGTLSTFTRTTFELNRVVAPGTPNAALVATTGDFVWRDCRFVGNTGEGPNAFGGGLLIANGAASIENCLFAQNVALGAGAAITTFNADVLITHSTFAANVSAPEHPSLGAVIYLQNGGNVDIVNSLFWGNELGGNDLVDGTGAITFEHTLTQTPCEPGPGNLCQDPLFVGAGDYRLRRDSPAIDRGLDAAAGPTDIDGNPRIDIPGVGNDGTDIADLGAFEVTSCADGVLSAGESDMDCGGPCPPCVPGSTCVDDLDCSTGLCNGGACESMCDGRGFGDIVLLTPASAGDEFERPGLATDGRGTWMMAYSTFDTLGGATGDDLDIAFVVSTDDRLSWSQPRPLNSDAATDDHPDSSVSLTTDGNGTWLAVWRDWEPPNNLAYAWSTDVGETWSELAFVQERADVGFVHQPSAAMDSRGRAVVVWEASNALGGSLGNDFDILAAYSDDGGRSWTEPSVVNVVNADSGSADEAVPFVVTDGQGRWVAAWRGGTLVEVATSSDGQAWSAPFPIAGSEVAGPRNPVLAADGQGRFMAVWHQNIDTPHVYLSRWSWGDASWTDAVSLTSGSLPAPNTFPWVAADGAGAWWVVWSNIGGGAGADTDVLYVRSTDFGATFSPADHVNRRAGDEVGLDELAALVVDPRGQVMAAWPSNGGLLGSGLDGDYLGAPLCEVEVDAPGD